MGVLFSPPSVVKSILRCRHKEDPVRSHPRTGRPQSFRPNGTKCSHFSFLRIAISVALGLFFFVGLGGTPAQGAADTIEISPAKLLPTEWADGDSFLVQFTDPSKGTIRKEVFRLYGVDCMETHTALKSDRQRLLEQSRHFGVEDPSQLITEGQAATKFVQTVLAKPFTVHTGFAQAMGRGSKPRYYAFITTSEGEDLAELLVKKGLARAKGISRQRADGTSREEYAARLADVELAAAIDRAGIWKLSNSARLAELRAQKRKEDRELAAIRNPATKYPLDINTATREELETLPGIGETLAARIQKRRPYQSLDDLKKVKGLSSSTLKKITPLLEVASPSGKSRIEPRAAVKKV